MQERHIGVDACCVIPISVLKLLEGAVIQRLQVHVLGISLRERSKVVLQSLRLTLTGHDVDKWPLIRMLLNRVLAKVTVIGVEYLLFVLLELLLTLQGRHRQLLALQLVFDLR